MSHYPPFRLERVREALASVYHLLGLTMPPTTVVPDLFDGYDLARADAAGVAQDACRCVLADCTWRATVEGVLETIWTLCWEDTLLINQRRFAERIGRQPDSRAERRAFSRTDFIGPSTRFAAAYAQAKHQATDPHVNVFVPWVFPRFDYKQIAACFRHAHEHGLLWYFPLDKYLILVPRPRIAVDGEQKLHSEDGPALAWRNGVKLCFLHGVWFARAHWEELTRRELPFAQVLSLPNIEQRRVASRLYSMADIVQHIGQLLEQKNGYELYSVPNIFREVAYFLKYSCPSTGREYISGIDPTVGRQGSVSQALRWKFQLEDCREQILFTEES